MENKLLNFEYIILFRNNFIQTPVANSYFWFIWTTPLSSVWISIEALLKFLYLCLSVYAHWNLRATKVICVKLDNGENFMKILSFIRSVYFNPYPANVEYRVS